MTRALLLLITLLMLAGAWNATTDPTPGADGDVSAMDDGGPTPPPSPNP